MTTIFFMPTDLKRLVEDAVHLAKPKWHNTARAEGKDIRLDVQS